MQLNYVLSTLAVLFLSAASVAQTTLYSENFNGASNSFQLNSTALSSGSSTNAWLVNNDYTGGSASFVCMGFPFSFTVTNTPAQPAGITGNPTSNYMHICATAATAGGINNSNYQAADGFCTFDENNFTEMCCDVTTLGHSNVSLSFWWLCDAEPGAGYGEVYYSTDGANSWNLLSAPVSEYSGQATWIRQTITNPAFDNQLGLRFGFRFVNSTSGGAPADPPFSIDDVIITGTAGGGCVNTTSSFSAAACDSYMVPSGDETYTVSGTYMDTIPNAGGCDSIMTIQLTVNHSTFYSYSVNSCGPFVVPSGNATYTVSGTYMDTIPNEAGCDSILTIHLTRYNTNTTLYYDSSGALIGVHETPGATYQWVDCNNGFTDMPGMTDSLFLPVPPDGTYAVIITHPVCSDISACVTISSVGINELETSPLVRVFPNPVSETLYIELEQAGIVTISDMLGRELFNSTMKAGKQSIAMDRAAKGIYFVSVSTAGTKYTTRIVKE
jgi:hypothetical protein